MQKIELSLGEEKMVKTMKFVMLMVMAAFALISVASASLPGAVTATGIYPASPLNSYWTIDVTKSSATEVPAALGYEGWCVDTGNSTYVGQSYDYTAYSSLGTLPNGIPTIDWKAINYILNVAPSNGDWRIRQAAMWHYDGMSSTPLPAHDNVQPQTSDPSGYNKDVYLEYIKDIDLHKRSFVTECGAKYAIILYHQGTQVVIVEGKTDSCQTSAPEFPSLALPVAMLIGVVGAVEYIKTRKE